jgi:hypothetical protein
MQIPGGLNLLQRKPRIPGDLGGLSISEETGKWTAAYPFCVPPTDLKDNYEQVIGYTVPMKKRLNKQNRTEEFNKQFYDTVERGRSVRER